MGNGADDAGLESDDIFAKAEEQADRQAEEEARKQAEKDAQALAAAEREWPLLSMPADYLEEKPDPPRWLLMRPPSKDAGEKSWKGFCRMGKVGVIAAPGGTGKTMAAVGLALAVSTGQNWLRPGVWSGRGPHQIPNGIRVDTPGRVAVLLAEEDGDDIRRRLFYTGKLMGLDPAARARARDRLFLAGLAGMDVSLVDKDGGFDAKLANLRRVLKAKAGEGWSLILVDPLARFAGIGAETDNALATRFVQALEQLTSLPGNPAVLFIHHERKGGGDGADAIRGSSALVDGARWALRLIPLMDPADRRKRWTSKRGERGVKLELVKTNYTPPVHDEYIVMQDSGHHGALRFSSNEDSSELKRAREAAEEAKRSRHRDKGSNRSTAKTEPTPDVPF